MSSDDDGYVHRPGGSDAPAGAADSDGSGTVGSPEASGGGTEPEGFGSRGWVLVGVLVVSTLVVPGVIYVRPGILSAVGIPYIASLLVLPLLPAAVLGLTAVWAMTAATRGGE